MCTMCLASIFYRFTPLLQSNWLQMDKTVLRLVVSQRDRASHMSLSSRLEAEAIIFKATWSIRGFLFLLQNHVNQYKL